MSTTQTGRSFIVSIPVQDVDRSKAFFTGLGFAFDERFGDGGSACLQIGDQASVMLLDRAKFAQFSHRPVADPSTHALALFSFGVATREEVDSVWAAAIAAGGVEADGLEDLGFMVTRSFFDLDGHGWQVLWMNPTPDQD